jgi:hypothetical protein
VKIEIASGSCMQTLVREADEDSCESETLDISFEEYAAFMLARTNYLNQIDRLKDMLAFKNITRRSA